MSFGGHVNDMVNRIKQNAALKAVRRRKFKGGNDYSKIATNKTEYHFPKLSNQEMKLFKTKVQEEAKLEKIKQLKIWAFVTMFVMTFMIFIFNYF